MIVAGTGFCMRHTFAAARLRRVYMDMPAFGLSKFAPVKPARGSLQFSARRRLGLGGGAGQRTTGIVGRVNPIRRRWLEEDEYLTLSRAHPLLCRQAKRQAACGSAAIHATALRQWLRVRWGSLVTRPFPHLGHSPIASTCS